MEMNVRDDQKLVEIWLTNAEKIDPVLVPSRFMRKIICRLRLNEVSRQ